MWHGWDPGLGLLGAGSAAQAAGFSPADLGMEVPGSVGNAPVQRVESVDELENALYLISRVQEASVQQERLVTTGKFKDVQRNSITMALNMMLDNYRLGDQIVTASGYVEPKERVVQASQVGQEAVDVLETAKEYFGTPLKVSGLSDDQRKFIIQAMQACREKLDRFLVSQLHQGVSRLGTSASALGGGAGSLVPEVRNELNMKEYVGEAGRWKEPKSKVPRCPDVGVELAWKSRNMDFAMPYLIQVLREYTDRVNALDKKTQKKEEEEEKNKSNPHDYVPDYMMPTMTPGLTGFGNLALTSGPANMPMMGGGMPGMQQMGPGPQQGVQGPSMLMMTPPNMGGF
ncbi:unnamed protein product [Effrenium voratum]|uniref:Uncharacterized protein n=1 Tax=Effrenium voratum TaxID=2562239 RepID=A0AA36HRL2_9DINO|nr:unnamed protein product [Effrenium voratum]